MAKPIPEPLLVRLLELDREYVAMCGPAGDTQTEQRLATFAACKFAGADPASYVDDPLPCTFLFDGVLCEVRLRTTENMLPPLEAPLCILAEVLDGGDEVALYGWISKGPFDVLVKESGLEPEWWCPMETFKTEATRWRNGRQ